MQADPLFDRLAAALVGRYNLVRQLGQGGMATVYLATDLKLGRLVAIKVLPPATRAYLGSERFEREVRLAAQLSHPHIVPLFAADEVEEFLFYVMGYVEGESLKERLAREGPLPLEDVIRVAVEIGDALQYAHEMGVVHRDVKPANILLSRGHAMVADFGVAKLLTGDATGPSSLTARGVLVGTLQYMSPEQLSADQAVDARSDVYSLAAVVYEMLTGVAPCTGPTVASVLGQVLTEPPRPIRSVRPNVPAYVEAAIEAGLAKRPADRPSTAREFIKRLTGPAGPARWTPRRGLRAAPLVRGVERVWQAALGPAPLRLPETLVPSGTIEPRRRRRLVAAVLVGGVLAAALIAGIRWTLSQATGPASALLAGAPRAHPDAKHVAVLYLETETPRLDLVAKGLTEALIDQLSQVEELHVVSANGVRPFRDRPVTLDSVVATLSVGTIVSGTLGGTPEQPWLTVRLIDPVTGRQLASNRLETSSGNILSLRGELIQQVAGFLRQRLGREIRLRELQAGTQNPQAWILVRRAESLGDDAAALSAAGDTAASRRTLDTADSLIRVAERLDRSWLDPVVLQGWIAVQRIKLTPGAAAPAVRRWAPRGLAQAERALALKRDDPAGLELRGYLRFLTWRYSAAPQPQELDAAERDLRAGAVPENPTQARAWSNLSSVLQLRGSFAEANLAAERAYATDAFLATTPDVLFRLHYTSLMLRRWREADDWCARGHARFPNNWRFTYCRLTLLYMPSDRKPDAGAAWRIVTELQRITSPAEQAELVPRWRMMVAGVLARAGRSDSARHTLETAKAAAGQDPEMDFYEAGVRVMLGEPEPALQLLERYLTYAPQVRPFLGGDPVFEPLHTQARFQTLVGTPQNPRE